MTDPREASQTTDEKRLVLVINQYAFPREYGGITRNFDMFTRLKKWTPAIVATSRHHLTGETMTAVDDRFTLMPVPAYSGNGAARLVGWGVFAAEAFAVGLAKRPRLVFGSSPQLLAAVSAALVSWLSRVPFVLEVRDLWPESLVAGGALERGSTMHRVLVEVERRLYRHADQIVVVTKGWEDHFEALGIDVDKVNVISNGADLAEFEGSETKDQLREEFGFTHFTCIFSGSHSPYVGLDLIVDAAEHLPDVDFVLIGSGSGKQAAIDSVEAKGLTNVRFLDQMPKDRMVRVLRAGDAGLHTVSPQSVFDKGMSPNKLFDYMAAGLTVVSNARVPLRDVIQDDEVGAVVEPNDLVSAIERVRDADESTHRRWRERSRQLMVERFSLQAAADKLEAVLDKAFAGH
ncbi:glycosyltransferase family 4 protein [Aestuariimicrobium kwangyangense]|uniref:glycosyltransferase family 4 protein n=1 Tax=Aestuariimicrobium kwangyangense TaxID=396389 RepID=UPI0003B4B75B|nr:glycosyltransferase family 4 protein [Aestuariimicrobium kwangyangense]